MKKSIFTTTLLFCSMLIMSCSNSDNSASQQNKVNPANATTATQVNSESISVSQEKLDNSKKTIKSASTEKTSPKNNQSKEIKNDNPSFGTIKDMQNGDLKCYVTVVDKNGKVHEGVGATFEVCEPEKYVNKKVKMSYSLENVSDCQSSEPCGKTIKEWLISKIEIQK
ncbi:MAG: hypothetical protein RM368_16960 [Nostoc sp. DedSLP03]|uniref:hypothetical protein n=1 Tax=Nostoc sp. DedSLP03 TaxID=3075400 RepID=UPI002AD1FE2B|nr:hypothetical protein [Nostoc sp. DedSLP03]MDZ7966639.1 hypothetical protein [Nostoc sp. DedSLP03]